MLHALPARGLTSRAFWEPENFSWTGELEAAQPKIKEELSALLRAKGSRQKKGKEMPTGWVKVGDARAAHDGDIVAPGGEWREFLIYGCSEHGPPDPDVAKYLPQTCALLERLLPGAIAMARIGAGEIIFSALAPGTRLVPHCASSNVRLTCHLGLVCPAGARLRVGREWRTWQEGRCLFFDDSFEHEVRYDAQSTGQVGACCDRVVLLLRFWHPDLGPERWGAASEHACQAVAQQIASQLPPLRLSSGEG